MLKRIESRIQRGGRCGRPGGICGQIRFTPQHQLTVGEARLQEDCSRGGQAAETAGKPNLAPAQQAARTHRANRETQSRSQERVAPWSTGCLSLFSTLGKSGVCCFRFLRGTTSKSRSQFGNVMPCSPFPGNTRTSTSRYNGTQHTQTQREDEEEIWSAGYARHAMPMPPHAIPVPTACNPDP